MPTDVGDGLDFLADYTMLMLGDLDLSDYYLLTSAYWHAGIASGLKSVAYLRY